MSRVLSKTEKKVVYKSMRDLVGIKCDCCEKIIPAVVDTKTHRYCKYYRVLTGHHDWGNDSCDSMVYRDVCPDCINDFVTDYIKKGTGTEYIEIETKCVYPVAVEYNEDEDEII